MRRYLLLAAVVVLGCSGKQNVECDYEKKECRFVKNGQWAQDIMDFIIVAAGEKTDWYYRSVKAACLDAKKYNGLVFKPLHSGITPPPLRQMVCVKKRGIFVLEKTQ